MAWQSSNQPGWNPDGPPITAPPAMAPTMPPGQMDQPGIPRQPMHPAHPGAPMAQAPPDGRSIPSSGCPPGLEYLRTLDQLLVDRKVELLEAFTGWEAENKYVVKDVRGQVVYYIAEKSDCCGRMCYGKDRAFDMSIVDATMTEVIHLYRPAKECSCCPLQEMSVSSNGVQIGAVVQNWTLIEPSFSILDASGDCVLSIKGPLCMWSGSDIDFDVLSSDGEYKVGRISKKWSGLAREMFTDSDMFGVSFPGDLDVKMKAVLLGACLLIDYMYFES